MAGSITHKVTELLRAWSDRDNHALEKLTPIIHAAFHRITKQKCGASAIGGRRMSENRLGCVFKN